MAPKRKKKLTSEALSESPPFEEAWSLEIKAGLYSNFCVDGRRVFVDQSGRGYSRYVVALEATTGRRLWKYPLEGRLLLAQDGVVLIDVGSWETHVVDATTGRPRSSFWSALRTRSRHDSDKKPVQSFGRHVVMSGEHDEHERLMMRCVDIHSGRRVWTYWPSDYIWTFALSKSRVVAQTQNGVQALDTTTGRHCWSHNCGMCSLEIVDDRVFLTGREGTIALDLSDGHALWRARRIVDWVGEGLLYGLSNGRVEVTDAATGRRVGRAEVEIRLPSSLRQYRPSRVSFVSQDHIFIVAFTGSIDATQALLCLTRDTGQYLWSHRPAGIGPVYEAILAEDGRIYYRSSDQAYCLEPTG